MSAINALLTRLNALEAKVTAQAETIELMSLMTPLEALNEGLKGAEPKAKKEFITLMQAMIAEFAEAPAAEAKAPALTIKAPASKGAKEVKEVKEKVKRAATNPTGPAAYNAKLQEVWQEMVEETGQEVEEGEGKLVEAAKKAGISYRDAQRETAIRQIMEQEGKDREEAEELFTGRKADEAARKAAKAAGLPTPKASATPKAKAEAGVKVKASKKAAKAEAEVIAAASAASSGPQTPAFPASPKASSASAQPALTIKVPKAAAKVATPQPEAEAEDEKATFLAGLAELGIEEKTIKGKVYYFDASTNEVFAKVEGVYDLGEAVGVLDAKTGKIVKA